MSRAYSASASRRPYVAWADDALTLALARGDEEAFREIYERYWYPLLQLATRKLGAREAAEELIQEVFVSLWAKHAATTIEQLGPYLRTAVKYRVIDAIKAESTQRRYLTASRNEVAAPDRSTEEHVAAADLSRALAASVQRLPAHTREVFRLSRTEHQSVPEIAARLHVSPKTVEYHLTRALKLLRASLKDFFVLALAWLAQ